MESEIQDILTKITDYDNLLNIHLITSIVDIHANNKKEYSRILQDIRNNSELLEKKILNVENEINKIKISHNKNNEKYKMINSDRLRLAKKYVDLENEFSIMKSEIDELDMNIKKYNEELKRVNKPSFNQLYLELVKGFGVEFVNDRRNICRIRSTRKKCLVEIELDKKVSIYKICNEIWENL
jgi:chromosome segregation ATPase